MKKVEVVAYSVRIKMCGNIQQAKQICLEFCYPGGLCVTITSSRYIYKGGEEKGFIIESENYPRFPLPPESIWSVAEKLAETLVTKLFQESYLLTDGVKTLWVTRREQ